MSPTLLDAAIDLASDPRRRAGWSARDIRAFLADPELHGEDVRRRLESLFALEMYRGRQARFLPRNPGESEDEFRKRPGKTFLNFTRLVIDVLSMLYKSPPERRMDGPPAVAQRMAGVWSGVSMELLLLAVDRLTRLLGTVAVRPFYDSGQVRYWTYGPHQLLVIEDDAAPWRPAAVAVVWQRRDSSGGKPVQRAHVWTAEEFADLAGGRVVERRAHGYGRIPLVIFRDRWSYDGFWSEGRGPAVALHNRAINARLADLGHVIKMQGFGVMQVVNPDPRQDLTVGPGNVLAFHVGAGEPHGIEYKSPGAPIADLLADLRFLIEELLRSQRIPESAISVNAASGASGVAIAAAQSPVQEDRAERMALFREGEADLADATLRVIAAHEPGFRFEPGAQRLVLNFPEPEVFGSPRDRIARDEFLLKHGLAAPWELMLRDNPDGYRDMAAAREAYFRRMRDMERARAPRPAN